VTMPENPEKRGKNVLDPISRGGGERKNVPPPVLDGKGGRAIDNVPTTGKKRKNHGAQTSTVAEKKELPGRHREGKEKKKKGGEIDLHQPEPLCKKEKKERVSLPRDRKRKREAGGEREQERFAVESEEGKPVQRLGEGKKRKKNPVPPLHLGEEDRWPDISVEKRKEKVSLQTFLGRERGRKKKRGRCSAEVISCRPQKGRGKNG